ncbi:VSP [Giardia duodenalis]|uniref:VSP n=1 Tax=Giardia intestinalis (strain ATCC 50803 / WB clone C6) TaxID=184922 RepID=A8B8R6_GIAIC|nr:VSP [Giardia intestinalis]KAE8302411.1 VSP [Giardia intestinalis]|eukprot:XP_001708666.1 VSP [Giardia lamblia ATCC 50803]
MLVGFLLVCATVLAKHNEKTAPCEVEGCDVCEESNPQQCKTCGSGYTLNPTTKKCTKNPASDCGVQNCAQCVSGDNTRCETCSPGFDPNDDGTQCTPQADCPIVNCQTCSPDKQTCEECEPGKHLTPTKKACLDACPVGTYLSGQTCAPCDPSCAECSGAGASKCTACPAGKMLRYADESNPTDGTCVEQCVEGPECETCGLTIGGTKYCSKCKGNNVPLNGVCTSNAARTRFCTTAANGACTVCAAGYFIQEGGCYQTTRLPGKSICTTPTGDGKCQTCANGLTAVSNMCPLCDSTCATCTEANQPNKCSACPPGRYLDASKACKLCTETSNNIQGVANCASCAPPSNNQGPVLCYLMKDGGSTNKSGLSTGAIAGISVAVIVVVGGLVGFLCWWFICRGKA